LEFIGEIGVDDNGVSRDAYSAFWYEVLEKMAEGDTERVFVPNCTFDGPEWKATGRILLKGFVEYGIFDIKWSLVFTMALVRGEDCVSDNMLLDSFLLFITDIERAAVAAAKSGDLDDTNRDDFVDLLCRLGSHQIPTTESLVNATLLKLARTHLIHEPRYATDKMASVAGDSLKVYLPDAEAVVCIDLVRVSNTSSQNFVHSYALYVHVNE
jgi:hypothetical protein